jgi:DNA polymerase-1
MEGGRDHSTDPLPPGGPVKCVTTMAGLKDLLEIYLDFPAFTFDVETFGTRRPRMLDSGRRILSRYEEIRLCQACGGQLPPRHRVWCDDICRQAATKDKPALDARTNHVWCLSLAGRERVDVIPMGHPTKRPQLSRSEVFDVLAPLFFSKRRKIGQNVSFDLLTISKYYDDEIPPPPYGDVMTMIFLINENLGRYSLGALTKHYHGFTYAEKLGEEAYKVSWDRATRYSALDAKWAWMLWWKLSPVLYRPGNEKLHRLFDLEMDVMGVLMEMRRTGAYVDVKGFRDLKPTLKEQLQALEHEIHATVGHDINLNSSQQLETWLYDELRLPPTKLTASGRRSTDAATLKTLARRHKAPAKILAYKEVNKLLSTYVAGMIPTIEEDHRIRASFNQARAKTGRLSCSAPNLQNIPARYRENTEGSMIRRLFVAPPGRVLIVADYSQIELRILAHQTRDAKLLYAYLHGEDLHTQTAALIWRVPHQEVTATQRSIAKNSNFNFAFEGGAIRVAQMSGIPMKEAEEVYEAWHRAYPGVKKWAKVIKRFCWDHGYVETLYGRKRRLGGEHGIHSTDWGERSYAERQAVNHPIQGTAADIAKVALVEVNRVLRPFDAALTLQIHDEFVIECSKSEVDDVIPLVKTAMEDIQLDGHPVLTVPLEVNIGVGSNWSEAK